MNAREARFWSSAAMRIVKWVRHRNFAFGDARHPSPTMNVRLASPPPSAENPQPFRPAITLQRFHSVARIVGLKRRTQRRTLGA